MLETALGCERVLSSLPMVRWAQPVFDSAAQLLESATSFIAANMSGVLASDRYKGETPVLKQQNQQYQHLRVSVTK